MKVYSISTLLEIANGDISISFPFLESFFGKYSQKVTEDRKTPLFSKTSKYSNFPVRCQWKGKGNRKESSQKKRVHKNQKADGWRTDKKGPTQLSDENVKKLVPTKIQKVSGIRGLAIKVLNKITVNNFDNQSSELLKILNKNKEKMSVKIIAELILEKIWYDKSFYELYVNLCKTLWEDNEWISECYEIQHIENEYFYKLCFEKNSPTQSSVKNGPFNSEEKAIEKAIEMANFKSVFISLCRDNFYKRNSFITGASDLLDSTDKYKLKRKLFGTVEIIGHLFNMGHLKDDIIHFIILSLLHTDNIHQGGAKYPDEIETLKLLWDIVYCKLGKSVICEYKDLLQKEMKKEWCSRIKFMIEDMLENIKSIPNAKVRASGTDLLRTKTDNKTNNTYKTGSFKKVAWKKSNDFKNDFKIKGPVHNRLGAEPNSEKMNNTNSEKMTNDIVKLSRHYNNDNKEDMFELLKSTKKTSSFSTNVVSCILEDSMEYGEYAESHTSTILSMLENYDISKLSFDNLSKAITKAGEDMCDIKIDAPKAPNNMSLVIGKILKGTKNGKIEININKTNFLSDYEGDPEETKKEWDNIVRLTEKIVDKDTLTTRFEILKFNNSSATQATVKN